MIKRIFNQASVVIGIFLLFGAYYYVKGTPTVSINSIMEKLSIWKLLLGAMLYLLSHFVRSMRLAIMVGREDISLRGIVTTQFYTNGINLMLPFKLGEVYRLFEFHQLIRNYKKSVSAIVAEKSLDFILLYFGLVASYYFVGAVNFNIDFTIYLCSAIAIGLVLLVIVLPQNIRSFNLFLAKRYSSNRLIELLSFTSKLQSIIIEINSLFREKIATLMVLTSLIWLLEISAFIAFIPFLPKVELVFLLAMLTFMSVFLPSGSFGIGGVQLAFYGIYLIDSQFPFLELSFIYQGFLFFPAITISILLFVRQRIKLMKNSVPIGQNELIVKNSRNNLKWINPLSYSMVLVGRIFKARVKN